MKQEIIKREIMKAKSTAPVTSTRLIEIVKAETGLSISARTVRFVVEDLRKKDHLPILATRKGSQGYYACRTIAEFEKYEKEVRTHALRELTTIKEIKQSFFGTKQGELIFI